MSELIDDLAFDLERTDKPSLNVPRETLALLLSDRAEVLRIAEASVRQKYYLGRGQDAGEHWGEALADIVEKLTGSRPDVGSDEDEGDD